LFTPMCICHQAV